MSADVAAANEPISFKRHFVLPGLVLTVLEPLLVVLPMLGLFRPTAEERMFLQSASWPILGVAVACWFGIMAMRLSPVQRTVNKRKRGEKLTDAAERSAYRTMNQMPLFSLWLRTALWMLSGVAFGMVLLRKSDWTPMQVVTLGSVFGLHAFLVNIVRALWYTRLAKRVKRELFPDIELLREFGDHYFPRIVLVSLAAAAGSLGALAAFVYYFLPIGAREYLRVMTYLPGALATVAFVGNSYARRAIEPIERYLAKMAKDPSDPGPDEIAVAAYRTAQTLPYRLAAAKVLAWTVASAGGAVLVRVGDRMEIDNAILMFCASVAIVVGAALYEAVWHRKSMRPILVHLVQVHRLPVRTIRSALSLRTKLLISFGGLVFFACGLSLFWGFIQYKKLASDFVKRQAVLKLDWVTTEVSRQSSGKDAADPEHAVWRVLNEASVASSVDGAVYVYIPQLEGGRAVSMGGGEEGAPKLPWYSVIKMRSASRGMIKIDSLRLSGNFRRMVVESEVGKNMPLGVVAVLYPGYRGRGAGVQRPLMELFVFFLLLFSACGGIVVITVGEYTRPIRHLEQRADAMARGELSEPVAVLGEADEIGRLTSAIEDMRQALQEKLRTIEGMNVDLEKQVLHRTADLEHKNKELGEALQQLTQAQSHLIRSEKMASIGQLVAGIAHEINNPVNAIVNTVGPLSESLEEVVNTNDGNPGDGTDEIRHMIKVIQRGASRTKNIVQALHNVSRADDEKIVKFDLNQALDDSLELLHHQLKDGTEVKREYDTDVRIEGHAGQLNQVFMNLFSNAAHAAAGREDAEIVVHTERAGKHIKISVKDNGRGIPDDVLPRIFDPFFTTKDVGEGTGLGLSIVHGIVDRHGGTIDVDSVLNKGTTFTVTLPVAQPRPTTS